MSEVKLKLLQSALERHEKIFPCGETQLLDDCFTLSEDKLLFWFNTEDDSTHVVEHMVNQGE